MEDFSYICVLQLQCCDGIIQVIAGSMDEKLLVNLQESMSKSLTVTSCGLADKVTDLVNYVDNSHKQTLVIDNEVEPKNMQKDQGELTRIDVEPDITVVEIIQHDDEHINITDIINNTNIHEYHNGKIDELNTKKLEKFVKENYKDDDKNYDADDKSTANENGETDSLLSKNKRVDSFACCPYKCGFCDDMFTKPTFLRSHIAVKHESDVDLSYFPPHINPYRCSYCDRVFNRMPSLTRHFVVHATDKPYRCDGHCDKTFGSFKLLERHVLRYKGILNYKCTVCGKAWLMKKDLNSHMVTHSNLKPFQCTVCGKRFARNTELTQHVQFHNTVRPYTCAVCGKSFKRTRDLTKHGVVHDPDRRIAHTCHVCNKGFVRKLTLDNHLQQHYKYS